MKTKSILLAALIGCMCVAPLRAENNSGDSLRNTDVLPDSTVEQIVSTLNQFDGIEGLADSGSVAIITHAKPYSLKDLERFILHVRPMTETELNHEIMQINARGREIQVALGIVFSVVSLPLIVMFIFMIYRQKRKNKDEKLRQETLREMAKSGVTVTPEIVAAVYGKSTGRVMVKPAVTGTTGASGVAEKNGDNGDPVPVYVDDPNEVKRKTEKSVHNLLLGLGFCFATFFLAVMGQGFWSWVFLIPGFALIAQGGSYLLTRLLTRESESKKK